MKCYYFATHTCRKCNEENTVDICLMKMYSFDVALGKVLSMNSVLRLVKESKSMFMLRKEEMWYIIVGIIWKIDDGSIKCLRVILGMLIFIMFAWCLDTRRKTVKYN